MIFGNSSSGIAGETLASTLKSWRIGATFRVSSSVVLAYYNEAVPECEPARDWFDGLHGRSNLLLHIGMVFEFVLEINKRIEFHHELH